MYHGWISKEVFISLAAGDNNWYRAVVLEIVKEEISVLFADYGNTEKLAVSRIAPIPKSLLEPPFPIIRCALSGEEVCEDSINSPSKQIHLLVLIASTSFSWSQAANPSLQTGQRKCCWLLKAFYHSAASPLPFTLMALLTCSPWIWLLRAESARRSWPVYKLNLMSGRPNRPLRQRPRVCCVPFFDFDFEKKV